MKKQHARICRLIIAAVMAWYCFIPFQCYAQDFTIRQAIEIAIQANLGLKISEAQTQAALQVKKKQRTRFFPAFSSSYQYKHLDEESSNPYMGILTPQDQYIFAASVTQPIFQGFALLNQYRMAELGVEIAKVNESIVRQEIIEDAKKAYYSILKAEKQVAVSQQAVTQLEAHEQVSKNFHKVGMIPLNDFLKSQVELANARQELIVAENNLDIARSNFNILLRRDINAPVELQDMLFSTTFGKDIGFCLQTAENNRLEIRLADFQIQTAEKEIDLVKKDRYPSVNLTGNYYRQGTEWDVDGGDGISDPEGWNIAATVSWEFWEWGRTKNSIKEKEHLLSQVKLQKEAVIDRIRLEVKEAYLNTHEAEKNIATVKEAVIQAKENFRISEERYKEQIATSTDVLDAQTLLSKTMMNYYNALYNLKIARASLYRAMGQEIME